MSDLEAVEGLDALPRRIFLEGERRPETDSDGFVRPSEESLRAEDLLACAAVLAAAPPWTGKSFVAKQLEASLRGGACDGTFCCPEFVERTCFEEPTPRLAPHWWNRWKDGDQRACWIVDAIDEDARRGRDQVHHILELIGELQESSRARLCSIFFVRISEIPKAFDDKIGQLFGGRLKRVRLVGLDREAAKTLVGAEQFVRVCTLLRENDLREIAALPPVLLHLLDLKGEVARGRLNQEAVWRGILKDLLREQPHRHRTSASEVEIEDRFEVAQRLATVVTFCGHQEISDPPRPGTLDLAEALPAADEQFRILRQAGREVMKSAVFERSDQGFRFSQDHVREWFAAFALQEMRLPAIRPLLEDSSGQPSHREIMRILSLISPDAEVRAWVLGIAIRELDHLQELARQSPWGLRLWQEERLAGFRLAGMGAEIARRLELDLHPAEQQFLLDLALVIDAQEPVAIAARTLQDERRDEQVRERAASLVARLGTVEHLAPLRSWVEAMQEAPTKAALSPLEVAFYRKGLWSFEKAAKRALSGRSLRSDWLQYRLADELTLDRARWLIGNARFPKTGRRLQPLLKCALEKIQEQATPEQEDIELLVTLLLERPQGEEREKTLWFLEGSPAGRRTLFREGFARDPEGRGEGFWVWSSALNGEDAGWLLDLFLARDDRPDWISGTLYWLAYREGVSLEIRRHVRRLLRDMDAGKIAILDRNRRKRNRKREPIQREMPPEFELEPLVRETLDSGEIELHHKMLQLSWYCFEPPDQRPSNLSGRWEDLPAELRSEVMALCRKALEQCPPTPIPASASYSQWTNWEAACFDRLAKEDSAFVLSSEMVRKWLPALLRDWVPGSSYEPTLRRCFEVDRQLAENLFAGAVHRSVLAEKSTYILHKLPPELWSEYFSSLLEAIAADSLVSPEMRIDLLVRIARIFPLRAQPIASAWAEGTEVPLRDVGVDLLLMLAPEEGWRHLRALIEHEKPEDIFRRMRSFWSHPFEPSSNFDFWPASQLAELSEFLLTSFPPDIDPKREAGEWHFLGNDDHLRSLRDHIPQLLYRREREGDHETLEALAAKHCRIREWLDDVRAHQGVESVIARLGRDTRPLDGRRVPLDGILKLLEDAERGLHRFRLLGSVEDLQEAVLEELRHIDAGARQHLSMLYRVKPPRGEKRDHLHEDALQAYLECRLSDRLPVTLEGQEVQVFVNRETLTARDKRNDLRIQANSFRGKKPLTVILEVKWSDNVDSSTSLATQLGEDYLRQSGYTHGVYLVGWCGSTQRWPDREACQVEMTEQARLFCQDQPDLRITPYVMDLSWGRELEASTS